MQTHTHIPRFHIATTDDEHRVDFGGFRVAIFDLLVTQTSAARSCCAMFLS